MCLAVPGQVEEVIDAGARTARVNLLGEPRVISLALVEGVGPGDWVLVYMGTSGGRSGVRQAVLAKKDALARRLHESIRREWPSVWHSYATIGQTPDSHKHVHVLH